MSRFSRRAVTVIAGETSQFLSQSRRGPGVGPAGSAQLRSLGWGSPSMLPVPWPVRPEPVAWRRGERWPPHTPVAGEAWAGKTVSQPGLVLTSLFQPVFESSFCVKMNGNTREASGPFQSRAKAAVATPVLPPPALLSVQPVSLLPLGDGLAG